MPNTPKQPDPQRQPDAKGFFTCLRCGHRWRSRDGSKPRICPGRRPDGSQCHSAYWDKPRTKPARPRPKAQVEVLALRPPAWYHPEEIV